MSKKILIVENDTALSGRMRVQLEQKGFTVQESQDAKGSLETIRRERPDLTVMGVELGQGQNGYILCGKLKKDDDLKGIPLIIVGNPDGFAQHKKLKTRADEYVANKKGDIKLDELTDRVGALIGFPELPVEESLTVGDLVDEEVPAEEISVEESVTVSSGDPDLDMLDAAFDASTDGDKVEEAVTAPPENEGGEEELSVLDSLGEDSSESDSALDALDGLGDDSSERTQIGAMPSAPPPPPPAKETPKPPPAPMAAARNTISATDANELRELRAKVSELQSALEEANGRTSEHESQISELQSQLHNREAELETAKSSSTGKSDKEFFALREAAQKKDKELLKVKGELNEKNKEITEKDEELLQLKEREMQLEQQVSESSGEMARRDAQIKTLTAKTEQLTNERKKVDQQLLQAKEEARSASSRLSALQADFDQAQSQLGELDELRNRVGSVESELSAARDEASDLRRQLEEAQGDLSRAREEAESARTQNEQGQMELDSLKNQISQQASAFADEAAGLRQRISELENASQKHEDRVTKFYQKIKGDEVVREKTKKALAIALQLLDEQSVNDVDEDPANA